METEVRLDFDDAVRGAEVPLRLAAPGRCERCGGTGARPGSTPRTCPTCDGVGLVSRSQGAFAFSEPCRDCRGTGRIIDDPCPECGGDGVSTRTRSLTVRVPAGVADGQQVRIKGKGEPGRGGAPAGDLFVAVHVTPHRLFGRSERNGDDLTLTVPVTYPELVLGTTLTVPTLDSTVSLKVPPGTTSGRTFRVRGRGRRRARRTRATCWSPSRWRCRDRLDDAATTALQAYAEATKAFDPRADLLRGGSTMDRSRDDRRAAVPPGATPDSPVFVISVAAELAGLHAQTLRSYDRLGLVSPGRSAGGGRRYSARDIALLREVQRLSQERGREPGRHQADHRAGTAGRRAAGAGSTSWPASCSPPTAPPTGQAAASVHASYRRDLVPVDRGRPWWSGGPSRRSG